MFFYYYFYFPSCSRKHAKWCCFLGVKNIKNVSTIMTAIWQYFMRTVCILNLQYCCPREQPEARNAVGASPHLNKQSYRFLFQCNQLNSRPRSLKVTSQLMRYSSVPFKHVLTLTSFYFSAIAEIFPPFPPWLCQPWPHHDYSLSPNHFILISPRAPHNYESPLKMANAWGKK